MAMQIHSGIGSRMSKSHGRRKSARRAMMSEINVTPFVDVMLVLLIIFMVTAPLMTSGVEVNLPEEETAPLPGQDEPLIISVTAKGEVFLQKTAVELDELGPKLIAITGQKTDSRIFIRGDKSVNYGNMITVMSEINKAGFTRVGLVTENQ